LLLWQNHIFLAKNILSSKQFETPMNMEITIVKTFCDFGHNFFKKQPFFIRSLAISYEKNLATLFRARPLFVLFPKLTKVQQH